MTSEQLSFCNLSTLVSKCILPHVHLLGSSYSAVFIHRLLNSRSFLYPVCFLYCCHEHHCRDTLICIATDLVGKMDRIASIEGILYLDCQVLPDHSQNTHQTSCILFVPVILINYTSFT